MNEERLHKPINTQQVRLVDYWVRGGRRSKAKALREAGYSEAVARNPHKVFGSPAVQQELERRGFGKAGVKAGIDPQPRLRDVRAEKGTRLFNALMADPEGLRKALNSVSYIPKYTPEEDRSGIKYREDLTLGGTPINTERCMGNTSKYSSM